jgi:hypothetical protein
LFSLTNFSHETKGDPNMPLVIMGCCRGAGSCGATGDAGAVLEDDGVKEEEMDKSYSSLYPVYIQLGDCWASDNGGALRTDSTERERKGQS